MTKPKTLKNIITIKEDSHGWQFVDINGVHFCCSQDKEKVKKKVRFLLRAFTQDFKEMEITIK